MRQTPAHADPAQLGFDTILMEAEAVNRAAAFSKAHGHLPGTMDEALPFYRALIERHHAAMLAGDGKEAMRQREESGRVALRLNKGEPGILAGPDAPGCRLTRLTAAEDGTVPLWGQVGSFIIDSKGGKTRIEMDGLFGIGASFSPWMNFSAHAVDWDRPFLSPTGYRSFMGVHAELVHGLMPDRFAAEIIAAHVDKALKGRLFLIKERYRR